MDCDIPFYDHLGFWYHGVDKRHIRRDNFRDWILWAFFSMTLEDLARSEDRHAIEQELDGYLADAERKFGIELPPGRHAEVKPILLNLDPVAFQHRPLAFYFAVGLLDVHTHLTLRAKGFKHYLSHRAYRPTFPPDVSHFCRNAIQVDGCVTYWFRQGATTMNPIVLVHGIGTGFHISLMLLSKLASFNVTMFCVELPYVSMKQVHSVPTADQFANEIANIIERHGYTEAIFAGHR